MFEYAHDRNIPVLSHMWARSEDPCEDISFFKQISRKYPRINFIVGHVGLWNGRSSNNYLEVAKKQKNVFLDLTASVCFFGIIERLVKEVGSEKLLYGSDAPLMDMRHQSDR